MITNYKPIDNGAGSVGAFEDNAPFGAAIANRLVNNTQYIHQNRLATHSKSWDYTIVNDQNLTTFTTAGTPSSLKGYKGYIGGGSLVDDPETAGVQFSTHPGVPMAIPFGWRFSPGAKFININIAMQIENAAGGMAAFARVGGQNVPLTAMPVLTDSITFEPPADFFNTGTRIDYPDAYKEVAITSLNGTSGMSYYTLQIEIPGKLDGSSYQEHSYQEGEIFLCFQSGYDPAGGTEQVNHTGPALSRGNRALRTNDHMTKYSGTRNPGKLHKLIKFTYTDTARPESWHHVLQLRPADVSKAPYVGGNHSEYVLWPAIPPDVVPPELTGGPGAGASEGTGLQLADNYDIYDLTVFTIVSVAIEESF